MVEAKKTGGPFSPSSPTFTLIVLGIVGVAAGLIIGIDDNLPGVAVLYGGLVCWALAVVHRWRKPRSFLWLTLGALGCFVVFAVLHNVFHGVGEAVADHSILKGLFTVVGVGSFLLAVLVAPPVLVVGLIGLPIAFWRSRRGRGQGEGTSEA
jgi:hypothetical protein